jgi:hypothetical protein
MADEQGKPAGYQAGKQEIQMVEVPDNAMASVAQFLKSLDRTTTPLVTGTGCMSTSGGDPTGDIHCPDTDPVEA